MTLKRNLSFHFLPPLILLVFSSGCATLALSAAGAGAGIGIPYIFTHCADRTLNYPFDQVDRAAPKVLDNLDMDLLEQIAMTNGKRIKASAINLDITIDIEKITLRATRVTINARKGSLIKDRATAEEIINQLERNLTAGRMPVLGPSPGKGKTPSPEKSSFPKDPGRTARPSFAGFQEGYQ